MIIIFGMILLVGRFEAKNNQEKIKANYKVVNGTITNVSFKSKLGYLLNYSFDYNLTTNFAETYSSKYAPLRNYLLHKSFPVVVSTANPKDNDILITPADFKNYNIPFPDSLAWVAEKLQ